MPHKRGVGIVSQLARMAQYEKLDEYKVICCELLDLVGNGQAEVEGDQSEVEGCRGQCRGGGGGGWRRVWRGLTRNPSTWQLVFYHRFRSSLGGRVEENLLNVLPTSKLQSSPILPSLLILKDISTWIFHLLLLLLFLPLPVHACLPCLRQHHTIAPRILQVQICNIDKYFPFKRISMKSGQNMQMFKIPVLLKLRNSQLPYPDHSLCQTNTKNKYKTNTLSRPQLVPASWITETRPSSMVTPTKHSLTKPFCNFDMYRVSQKNALSEFSRICGGTKFFSHPHKALPDKTILQF